MFSALLDVCSTIQRNFAVLAPRVRSFPWKPGQPSIDIVIPACGDEVEVVPSFCPHPIATGLYMTIASCERELRSSGLDYRYYVVDNGNAQAGPFREALDRVLDYADKTGRATVIRQTAASCPPAARNLGASQGKGDILCFLDNHCDLAPGYFKHTIATFENFYADSVRGVIVLPSGESVYEYARWETKSCKRTPLPDWLAQFHVQQVNPDVRMTGPLPYRIVTSGHGAFSIRRDVWNEIDGYWDGLTAYQGDEFYLDLKLGLLGKSVWMNPQVRHVHHSGSHRRYKAQSGPEFLHSVENILCTAYIIGGEKLAYEFAECRYRNYWATAFMSREHRDTYLARDRTRYGTDAEFRQMLLAAIERSTPRREWLASRRVWTLDEMLNAYLLAGVSGACC